MHVGNYLIAEDKHIFVEDRVANVHICRLHKIRISQRKWVKIDEHKL